MPFCPAGQLLLLLPVLLRILFPSSHFIVLYLHRSYLFTIATMSADLFVGGGFLPSGGHNLYSIAGELMSSTPFGFDHVENFFAIREWSGPVDFIIAEDNETTIKIRFK